MTITELEIAVDFTKIDDNGGSCGPPPVHGGGPPFNGEISLRLTSPWNEAIDLVQFGMYTLRTFATLN